MFLISSKTIAQSLALLAIGPTLSILQDKVIKPSVLIFPKVGLNPLTPHLVEGDIIEPKVSVPIAKLISPAATAEADPAEDPLEP